MPGSGNKPSHLRALLKKNWILWKRSWCVSCLEIIIPALFAFILVGLKQVAPVEDIPENSYYDSSGWLYSYDGTAHYYHFKDCSGSEDGGLVALVPPGDPLITSLKSILGKKFVTIPH